MTHIVKIGDKYALRRKLWFCSPKYFDLKYRLENGTALWWSKKSRYFSDCLGTEEEVRQAVQARNEKEERQAVRARNEKEEIIERIS